MAIDNEADDILIEARNNMPCILEFPTYNDTVSMQARLKKHIRVTKDVYFQMGKYESPYDDIEVTIIKPRMLRFSPRQRAKMQPDVPWSSLINEQKS